MTTKTLMTVILAFLVTTLMAGTTPSNATITAENEIPWENPIAEKEKVIGQILDIDKESITINALAQGKLVIYLNGNTLIPMVPAGTEVGSVDFSDARTGFPGDLAIGNWIIAYVYKSEGKIYAQTIILIPEPFDTAQ